MTALAQEIDGPDEVRWNDVNSQSTTRRLARLEKLVLRNVITPRMYSAGIWLAARHEAYFCPGSPSLEEVASPMAGGADPTARWARGQRTTLSSGKARTPPPSFRARRPKSPFSSGDGWTIARLNALQDWKRAYALLRALPAYDRSVVELVAIEGRSLQGAALGIIGTNRAPGGTVMARVRRALCDGLDAIADETEGRSPED